MSIQNKVVEKDILYSSSDGSAVSTVKDSNGKIVRNDDSAANSNDYGIEEK